MAVERLKVISRHLRTPHVIRSNPLVTWNLTMFMENQTNDKIIEDREFRYTLNNPVLTIQQRQFYEDNGYLIIPNLIEKKILDECRKHFVDICEGRFPKGMITLMKDKSLMNTGSTGEYLYYKLQDIHTDEIFLQYLAHPKMLDFIECFTGPNITTIHSMLINKPPTENTNISRHPVHQDLYYFPYRPADRIVGSWTAMETINEKNGCLFIIPGSHKTGQLYKHDYPKTDVNAAFHGVLEFEDHPTLSLCMEKGDTVFLHPLVLHGSGVNSTKGFRKAISCHYAASECHFIDVKGTLQEKIATEIEEIVTRRGFTVDYNTIWKAKSMVVRGNEGLILD